MEAWNGFTGGSWETEINVRDFIQKNYTPYDGDGSFLVTTGDVCLYRLRHTVHYVCLLFKKRDKTFYQSIAMHRIQASGKNLPFASGALR